MLQNSVEQEEEEEEKSSQEGDYLHPAQILQRYPQRIYSIIFVSLGYPSLVMKELCMAKMHAFSTGDGKKLYNTIKKDILETKSTYVNKPGRICHSSSFKYITLSSN